MAKSPAHRFGQIIGDVLQAAVVPLLGQFAARHGLYLDRQGDRPCRTGKKCSWIDRHQNSHDLDFVLERGGTAEKKGVPAAFIEVAWRRYTRHSKNKAQEIQGAIMPLVETYHATAPFQGAILAGVFTGSALTQLRSLGFTVLYFPYETVVGVFRKFGINAAFDEETPDEEFKEKVDAYEALAASEQEALAQELLRAHADDVDHFIASLTKVVSRQIEQIVILPLHGSRHMMATIEEAIDFINGYNERARRAAFVRYEIQVRYNNGNEVRGTFGDKQSAVDFLRIYQPVLIE